MMKALHLGQQGEEVAQHLLSVYELTTTFEPCLLFSPHPQALAEVRRRLAEVAERVERWEPDENLLERARKFAATVDPKGPRPIIWLEQGIFAPEPWQLAFHSLNWSRETYRDLAPWMWVFAGPDELLNVFRDRAPDLFGGVAVSRRLAEKPMLAPVGGTVRWLHLSDFHFKAEERWDRRATLEALIRHAAKLKAEGLAPDWVFITGDVAWSGKKAEYEQAERFFRVLADKLRLDPQKDFFVIPGNHDVDRSAIGRGEEILLSGLQDEETVEEVFRDGRQMDLLSRRLKHFYAFTARLLGPARAWRPARPWRVDVREVGTAQVAILQLNSAWASGPKDEAQRVLVGEYQLREALEEASEALLRVALVHHPTADLRAFDASKVLGLLGAPGGAHFLLRGHLHEEQSVIHGSPDGSWVELAAGAVYTGGRWPRAFLATEVELAAGAGAVHFFGYSDKGNGFWHRDAKVYERAPEGIWRFRLPAGLALGKGAPAPHREARRASLTARYRSAAAAVYGTVKFLGFADPKRRLSAQVPELFVPLRLRKGEKEVWQTSEMLRFLLGLRKKQTPRAVVLGDPGSGKTTLCRFLAVVLAGEAKLEEVTVGEEILPLLLPFREYARECRENGGGNLLASLEKQAEDYLQVTLPKGFLEEKLDAGEAVLFLDGLDEVGSAGERDEMRERVLAFGRSHPRVAMLVTSRIAGYTEAPLPESGPDGFAHLHLAPFEDDDLREFVRHWYAIQEADDPVARDRGTADLLAALEADPHVRELARNPMLATLIALVHRYEAHLPGERAKLYELCVKTLLETWTAARKQMFHEIDVGLQRAYLEALAWRMQTARKSHQRDVTIERKTLLEVLEAIVRERGDSGVKPAMLESWVRYLETGTGLLVEQRPRVLGFFHLSLMEYLAACALDASTKPEEKIARRYADAGWREVCLLAVGRRATDKAFLDRLYERFEAVGEESRWSFLLACLREEAAFDDRQRETIVAEAALALLDQRPFDWQLDYLALDEIMRFSMRHGKWARGWVDRQLRTARGRELRAVVTIRIFEEDNRFIAILKERPDAADAASALRYFGKGALDRWVEGRLDAANGAEAGQP